MAETDSTRSERSSAREDSAASRSERAETSSGEDEVAFRDRMRRYEEKRGRVWVRALRTSLSRGRGNLLVAAEEIWGQWREDALLDLEERILVVGGGHHRVGLEG